MTTKVLTHTHGVVRALSKCEDVRRHFIPPLGTVDSNSSHGVDRKPLAGINCDTEEATVGVYEPLNIALLQVKQDRSIIEVSQVRHILATVVLRRVNLTKGNIRLKNSFNTTYLGYNFLFEFLNIAKLLFWMRNITRVFWIIGLFIHHFLSSVETKRNGVGSGSSGQFWYQAS